MNINDLESIFEERILGRGRAYAQQGNVTEISKAGRAFYTASVEGSETYTVGVRLLPNGDIRSLSCTCPYAKENYCKHEAAVLMILQDAVDEYKDRPDLQSILEKAEKEQIVKAVFTTAYDDPALLNKLIRYIERYASKDILKSFMIGFEDAFTDDEYSDEKLEDTVTEALETVKASDNVTDQTLVLLGMLRAMNDRAGDSIDDPYLLYSSMDDTADTLAKVNEALTAANDKAAVSAQWAALTSAMGLLPFEDSEKRWFTILLPFGGNRKYLDELFMLADSARYESTEIKLMLAEKWYSDDELAEFITANTVNDEVLRFAYRQAMKKNDLSAAEHYALLGHERESKRSLEWLECLQDIYVITGDNSKLCDILYEMTLRGSIESYVKLSQLTPEDKLKETVDRLLSAQENLCYEHIIIKEKRTDLMIEYCRKHKQSIADMAMTLSQSEYRDEAKAIFIGYIRAKASASYDRQSYSEIAELLINYMGCFGAKAANKLTRELRHKYNNRPAFLDELDKAGCSTTSARAQ